VALRTGEGLSVCVKKQVLLKLGNRCIGTENISEPEDIACQTLKDHTCSQVRIPDKVQRLPTRDRAVYLLYTLLLNRRCAFRCDVGSEPCLLKKRRKAEDVFLYIY